MIKQITVTVMSKKVSHQIKTTLPESYQKVFESICEEKDKKESELAREAIIKYLKSYSSSELIEAHKEMCLS